MMVSGLHLERHKPTDIHYNRATMPSVGVRLVLGQTEDTTFVGKMIEGAPTTLVLTARWIRNEITKLPNTAIFLYLYRPHTTLFVCTATNMMYIMNMLEVEACADKTTTGTTLSVSSSSRQHTKNTSVGI